MPLVNSGVNTLITNAAFTSAVTAGVATQYDIDDLMKPAKIMSTPIKIGDRLKPTFQATDSTDDDMEDEVMGPLDYSWKDDVTLDDDEDDEDIDCNKDSRRRKCIIYKACNVHIYTCMPMHIHRYKEWTDNVGTCKEAKFIVFLSVLVDLFKTFIKCPSACEIGIKEHGTLVTVTQQWTSCGYIRTWNSQPR